MELTELRDVPPKMRSAPVVIGTISLSSWSVVVDEEARCAGRGEHADDRDGHAVDVDRLADRVARPKSSDAVVAPSTTTAAWSLTSWLSMKRPSAMERPRTVSHVGVVPCTVVVQSRCRP